MITFEHFLILPIIVYLIFSSIIDFKYKELSAWVCYLFILMIFVTRIIYTIFIEKNWTFLAYGLIGFSVAYAIGAMFEYYKKWGSADTLFLGGLGLYFGFNLIFPSTLFQYLIILCFIGMIYSLVYFIFFKKDLPIPFIPALFISYLGYVGYLYL